jgi:hypothetical protein
MAKRSGLVGRLFIVVGLAATVASLASNPSASPKILAAKPPVVHQVPVFLIDRKPPLPSAIQPTMVDRDPPDQCFEPRSRSNAGARVACG